MVGIAWTGRIGGPNMTAASPLLLEPPCPTLPTCDPC